MEDERAVLCRARLPPILLVACGSDTLSAQADRVHRIECGYGVCREVGICKGAEPVPRRIGSSRSVGNLLHLGKLLHGGPYARVLQGEHAVEQLTQTLNWRRLHCRSRRSSWWRRRRRAVSVRFGLLRSRAARSPVCEGAHLGRGRDEQEAQHESTALHAFITEMLGLAKSGGESSRATHVQSSVRGY
eukprot:7391732-Prymnesium_polylepis.3